MYLTTDIQGYEGSESGGGEDVRPPLPEYCRPVYLHSDDTGAMYVDGAKAGSEGDNEMVGAGLNQPRTRVDIYTGVIGVV